MNQTLDDDDDDLVAIQRSNTLEHNVSSSNFTSLHTRRASFVAVDPPPLAAFIAAVASDSRPRIAIRDSIKYMQSPLLISSSRA